MSHVHMKSMVDLVAINIETPRIEILCFGERVC